MRILTGVWLVMMLGMASAGFGAPDARLEKIREGLPRGWEMTIGTDTLTVLKTEECWVMFENRINAPALEEKPEERLNRIMKHGRKIRPRLVFALEPRWPEEKLSEARRRNDALAAEIAGLPKRLGIESLLDSRLSRKGGPVLVAGKPADNAKIERFEKEKKRLADGMQRLPEFHSTLYSLFSEAREGLEDEFHIVHPVEVSQEAFGIIEMFKSTCAPTDSPQEK